MGERMVNQTYTRIVSKYVPVVIDGKLAFRYDPARNIIEWQHRGDKHYIDLSALVDENEKPIDNRVP